jgi:hypothetical protein
MGSLPGKNRSWNILDPDSSRRRTHVKEVVESHAISMKDFKVRLTQHQARDCSSVSIEHQLKPQAMPGLHTTVLGGVRWCVMVAPNGSARCGSRVRLAVPERGLPW